MAELCDVVYENIESRTVELKIAGGFSAAPSGFTPALVCSAPPRRNLIVWRRKTKWWNRLGFYAALYCRESDGMQVLAYRGTDELLTDTAIDDAIIAAGGVPPQAAAAFEVVRQAGLAGNAYLTGHSLGGALAILAAARSDLPAVTFNAPGVMDSCVLANTVFPGAVGGLIKAVARCVGGSRLLNVRIPADPVSSYFTTGRQPGRSLELAAPNCSVFNVKCRHGIKTCVEQVKNRADAYAELDL